MKFDARTGKAGAFAIGALCLASALAGPGAAHTPASRLDTELELGPREAAVWQSLTTAERDSVFEHSLASNLFGRIEQEGAQVVGRHFSFAFHRTSGHIEDFSVQAEAGTGPKTTVFSSVKTEPNLSSAEVSVAGPTVRILSSELGIVVHDSPQVLTTILNGEKPAQLRLEATPGTRFVPAAPAGRTAAVVNAAGLYSYVAVDAGSSLVWKDLNMTANLQPDSALFFLTAPGYPYLGNRYYPREYMAAAEGRVGGFGSVGVSSSGKALLAGLSLGIASDIIQSDANGFTARTHGNPAHGHLMLFSFDRSAVPFDDEPSLQVRLNGDDGQRVPSVGWLIGATGAPAGSYGVEVVGMAAQVTVVTDAREENEIRVQVPAPVSVISIAPKAEADGFSFFAELLGLVLVVGALARRK